MTATLETGLPADYMDLLALYPWIKVQPHEWDGKTEAERLGLVVAAARAQVDAEEERLGAIQRNLTATASAYDNIKSTPVFRLVPGNVPGTHDIEYDDETTSWDGTTRTQPFRIVNPQVFTQGRAILAQMAAYDALKRERDALLAQVEELKKARKK